MSSTRGSRAVAALLAAVAVAVLLAGCVIQSNKEAPVSAEDEAKLESAVLAATEVASGVYVSQTFSGAGNHSIQVRLYVTSDELTALSADVDAAFETTWRTWPVRPSVIKVGVVVGEKPVDVGTADANIRDLEDVALELGIDPKDVRVNIILTAPPLEQRYGAWTEPTGD